MSGSHPERVPGSGNWGNRYNSSAPTFIDPIALDIVVTEHKYMPMTPGERRHAAHRLREQGLETFRIAAILRLTERTVSRMLDAPPPPALDVDETGHYISEGGEVLQAALDCPLCGGPVYGTKGLCRMHWRRQRINAASS